MEHTDQDLRKVILILIDGLKEWQVRAHVADKVLSYFYSLPPTTRAAMRTDQIAALVSEARPKLEVVAQKLAENVEKALNDPNKEFFLPLQMYASMQYWKK